MADDEEEGGGSGSYLLDGLEAAGRSLAKTMKKVAGVRTRTGANAVNFHIEGDRVIVRAGKPGGQWGWDPVVPSMFDNNRRHPFFGDKKKWYNQGYYGITEITEEEGAEPAAEAFVKGAVDPLLRDHGFED